MTKTKQCMLVQCNILGLLQQHVLAKNKHVFSIGSVLIYFCNIWCWKEICTFRLTKLTLTHDTVPSYKEQYSIY